jgi:hypothetical protein
LAAHHAKSNQPQAPIAIYQTADGSISTEVRLEGETVWLTQAQMVELFQRNQSVISRHIRNFFGGRIGAGKQYAKNAYCSV